MIVSRVTLIVKDCSLVPAALILGGLGLGAFLWALRSGQFEDLDGAAYRALEDEDPPDVDDEHKRSK